MIFTFFTFNKWRKNYDVSAADWQETGNEFISALDEAKEKGGFLKLAEEQQAPAHEYTFDSKTTDISKEIVAAADKLKEGEFAEIVESNGIYYVVQLISEFDKDATQAKKDQIVADRQAEKFESLYKPWQDATEIVIDDSVVADISLHGLQVKPITKK